MNEDRRKILWTGGFDSTFAVIEALERGFAVETVVYRGYGMSRGWQKVDHEDAARDRILHALPSDMRKRVHHHVELDYAFLYPTAKALHEEFVEKLSTWSPQNFILGALPKLTGTIEVGYVATDESYVDKTMRSILYRSGLRMPIAHKTKPQMLSEAINRGFDGVLKLTWSCEGNKPNCGECEPCVERIIPQTPFPL